jgi:hypothetical protein
VKPKWRWLPPWNMPSDPVRAVFWFFYWVLQMLVRYCSVLVLAGAAYEAYVNGVVGFAGTLLVGLLVWAGLAGLLVVVRVGSGVSRVYAEINRLGRDPTGFAHFSSSAPASDKEEKIVEGSIITDLEEERKRRRQEI